MLSNYQIKGEFYGNYSQLLWNPYQKLFLAAKTVRFIKREKVS